MDAVDQNVSEEQGLVEEGHATSEGMEEPEETDDTLDAVDNVEGEEGLPVVSEADQSIEGEAVEPQDINSTEPSAGMDPEPSAIGEGDATTGELDHHLLPGDAELQANADEGMIHPETDQGGETELEGKLQAQFTNEDMHTTNDEETDMMDTPKSEPTGETDDLATLANAALTCDQAASEIKTEEIKKEPVWCDVGVIRGTSCFVSSYNEPSFSHDPEHEFINLDNLPDLTNSFKIELEPGTAYKFRVAAINTCGRGPWSEVSAFKTSLPGYPGAPSSIKISKSADGAHLSWEPPSNPAGTIVEYSVCLAVRNTAQSQQGEQKGHQLAFVRVYSGPQNQTIVPNASLAAAHIDTTSKPAIIFRIAAKNEKGFGPATQVRWLQDVVASPGGGVKPIIKKEPISTGIPIKRQKLDDL